MSDVVIQVENIAKRYKVATAKYHYDTVADQLTAAIGSLFRKSGRRVTAEKAFWALKDISFDIRQGEILGIVGRNGAGKSTLLKILSQITAPTEGRVNVFGRIGSLLEVGTGFHPELSGRENIYLNGAIIGMKKEEIRRQFDAIVEFSGVGQFLDTPVKRYSSGMYVRLAFAVAAHLEPEILLLDEVLAVGDSAFQKKCLGKIDEVAKGGRTVIFISHNMTAVNSLCQRVIWIDGGKIVADGPSAQVVSQYLASSVKDLAATEEVWEEVAEAPGSDDVRLHRVRVRRQDGHPSEPISMQTPFQVEVEYWNMSANAEMHVTMHLYTAEGLIAFTTGSRSSGPMPRGLVRCTGYFPGDLLNSGMHRFVVLFIKNASSLSYSHESPVPINIVDLRQRDGAYFGKEPGVVQPMLNWTTEFVRGLPEVKPAAEQGYPTLAGVQCPL